MKRSQSSIAEEYKQYARSQVMDSLGRAAHGSDYCGQTSSATFHEISQRIALWHLPREALLLDAGCGNGCFLLPLQKHFAIKAIGIDLSQDLIEKAKEKDIHSHCQFIQGDYANLPSEIPQLDAIICIGSMYWNQSLETTLHCWSERLKEGGKCLIFLNVSISPLTDEEQKRAGGTQFFIEKNLLEKIGHHLEITELLEENATYIAWLQKWCAGMDLYEEDLVREFGEEFSKNMKIRFEAYLEFAKSGKTKRLIIESHKKG